MPRRVRSFSKGYGTGSVGGGRCRCQFAHGPPHACAFGRCAAFCRLGLGVIRALLLATVAASALDADTLQDRRARVLRSEKILHADVHRLGEIRDDAWLWQGGVSANGIPNIPVARRVNGASIAVVSSGDSFQAANIRPCGGSEGGARATATGSVECAGVASAAASSSSTDVSGGPPRGKVAPERGKISRSSSLSAFDRRGGASSFVEGSGSVRDDEEGDAIIRRGDRKEEIQEKGKSEDDENEAKLVESDMKDDKISAAEVGERQKAQTKDDSRSPYILGAWMADKKRAVLVTAAAAADTVSAARSKPVDSFLGGVQERGDGATQTDPQLRWEQAEGSPNWYVGDTLPGETPVADSAAVTPASGATDASVPAKKAGFVGTSPGTGKGAILRREKVPLQAKHSTDSKDVGRTRAAAEEVKSEPEGRPPQAATVANTSTSAAPEETEADATSETGDNATTTTDANSTMKRDDNATTGTTPKAAKDDDLILANTTTSAPTTLPTRSVQRNRTNRTNSTRGNKSMNETLASKRRSTRGNTSQNEPAKDADEDEVADRKKEGKGDNVTNETNDDDIDRKQKVSTISRNDTTNNTGTNTTVGQQDKIDESGDDSATDENGTVGENSTRETNLQINASTTNATLDTNKSIETEEDQERNATVRPNTSTSNISGQSTIAAVNDTALNASEKNASETQSFDLKDAASVGAAANVAKTAIETAMQTIANKTDSKGTDTPEILEAAIAQMKAVAAEVRAHANQSKEKKVSGGSESGAIAYDTVVSTEPPTQTKVLEIPRRGRPYSNRVGGSEADGDDMPDQDTQQALQAADAESGDSEEEEDEDESEDEKPKGPTHAPLKPVTRAPSDGGVKVVEEVD